MQGLRRLRLRADGGFHLECPAGSPVEADRMGDGWKLTAPGESAGARIEGVPGGLVMMTGGGAELGRVSRGDDGGGDTSPTILLDDGRLFRVIRGTPRQGRYELTGWETRGAYFEARPDGKDWVLTRTVAGAALGKATTLLTLFCAELLAADGTAEEHGRVDGDS